MKTEIISVSMVNKKLHHFTSAGFKEIKLDKNQWIEQSIQYIEQYVTGSGFSVLSASPEGGGFVYILIKDNP